MELYLGKPVNYDFYRLWEYSQITVKNGNKIEFGPLSVFFSGTSGKISALAVSGRILINWAEIPLEQWF